MFTVSRELNFCYGHRLLEYAGKCKHLHGHNARAIISFDASGLDSHGMVVDFSEVKQVLGRWIDENLDHRMILCRTDAAAATLQEMGEPVYLLDANPTAENIAKCIFEIAAKSGFPVVEVKLWETPHCCATYRPTTISRP